MGDGDLIGQSRLGAPTTPAQHVIDRHGYIWRLVHDGGMATRADDLGLITEGIVALERRAGPLINLSVIADACDQAASRLDSEEHRYVERFDSCPNGCAFRYDSTSSGMPMVRTAGPADCSVCDHGTVEDDDGPAITPLVDSLRAAAKTLTGSPPPQ